MYAICWLFPGWRSGIEGTYGQFVDQHIIGRFKDMDERIGNISRPEHMTMGFYARIFKEFSLNRSGINASHFYIIVPEFFKQRFAESLNGKFGSTVTGLVCI